MVGLYGDAGKAFIRACIFVQFWYIDGWGSSSVIMRPICKIGCILENLRLKSTSRLMPQLFGSAFSYEKWYLRWVTITHAFWGNSRMVATTDSQFKLYFEHPRENEFFWRTCPGLPFAQDFGKAGPTAPFCRKGLKCRRPACLPGSLGRRTPL